MNDPRNSVTLKTFSKSNVTETPYKALEAPEDESEQHPEKDRSMIGLGLFALSGLTLVASATLLKDLLERGLLTFEVLFLRYAVQFPGLLLICALKNQNPGGLLKNRKNMFLKGVTNSVFYCFYYLGFVYLPLSDGVVAVMVAPIFVVALAKVTLNEPIGIANMLATLGCICGIFFVARPVFVFGSSDETDFTASGHLLGIAISVIAAFFQAISIVFTRTISKDESTLAITSWVAGIGLLVSAIAAGIQMDLKSFVYPTTAWEITSVLSVGVLALITQILSAKALLLAPAGICAIVMNIEIVFAYIFQISVLHEHVFYTSVVGAILITLSSIGAAIAKYWRQQKDNVTKTKKEIIQQERRESRQLSMAVS